MQNLDNKHSILNSTATTSNARFLLKYLLHHKKSYGLGILFIFITNWLAVNIPVHIGASIDLLSGELEKNQQQLIYNIATVIGFALIMIVTRTVSRIYFFNPGRAIERELKNDAFAKLTFMQRDFYTGHETGTLISIVNNDINGVRALAGVVMLQIFNIAFALSLTPVKMWQISASLTLYCVLPVVVTFFIAHRAIAYMRAMMKKRMAELQTLSSQTVGILSGIEEIKSYQVQPWAVAEFETHNEAILQRSLMLARVRTLVLPIIGYTDRVMKVLILADRLYRPRYESADSRGWRYLPDKPADDHRRANSLSGLCHTAGDAFYFNGNGFFGLPDWHGEPGEFAQNTGSTGT